MLARVLSCVQLANCSSGQKVGYVHTFEFLTGVGVVFVFVGMPFHSTLLVCLLDFILGGIWLDC